MTNIGEIPSVDWPDALGVQAARQMTINFVWKVVLFGTLILVSAVRLLSSAGFVDRIPFDVQLLVVLPIEVIALVFFWATYQKAKKFAAIEYGVSPQSANVLAVANRKKFLDSVVRARQQDLQGAR